MRKIFKLSVPDLRALVLLIASCVLLPALLVTVHINKNPELSPTDEAAHYDYVTRASQWSIPRLGQPMQQDTFRVAACRGTALNGLVTPKCGLVHYSPATFAGGGLSYEAQQPPAYYFVTAAIRWFPEKLLGVSSFTAARLVGIFWLVAALTLFWIACRLQKIKPLIAASGCVLMCAAPVVLYSASNITNDASSLFCGCWALVLGLLATHTSQRHLSLVFLASGILLPLFKATNILAVVAVSLGLLLWFLWNSNEDAPAKQRLIDALKKWLPNGGIFLLGGVFSVLAWALIERHMSLINPTTLITFDVLRTRGVGLSLIASEAVALFGPLVDAPAPLLSGSGIQVLGNPTALNLYTIFKFALLYLPLAAGLAILFKKKPNFFNWLGFLTLGTLYFGGFILGCAMWKTYDIDPGLSGRYGLCLAPFLIITVLGLASNKLPRLGIWFLGLIGVALDLWIMLIP